MDMVYYIYCLLLGGKLYFVLIGDNVQCVFDFGIGIGIWVMNFVE